MSKIVQKFILIIVAATVFFTGTGVTIINYCCDNCSMEQTLVMTKVHSCCSQQKTTSCCSTHEHTVSHHMNTGEHTNSKNEHCTTLRLSTDIDISVFRSLVSNPFIWITENHPILSENAIFKSPREIVIDSRIENPPNVLPREYLSLIRILII